MRKSKSYYTTEYVNIHTTRIQKLAPDLEPVGPPYTLTELDGGGVLCTCIATKNPCRHIAMLRKFKAANQIGKHPPFDFDNQRFFEPPKELLDG